ncbi:MAG TPA: ABC transporter permease [Spirochaetales bacterium]|nr:ABC transporter permease [Spirochaetales bacterium]HRY54193.1 ABC transporter permease [Spirochaetia bacterium]HRZ64833.1 ABC transporter permease [Spirochaetia bacterium]
MTQPGTELDFTHVGAREGEADSIKRPSLGYFQDARRRFKANGAAMAGLAVLALLAALSLAGPLAVPYNHEDGDLLIANRGPDSEHWFGTDDLGRDYWARIWVGGRVSMAIGILAALLQGCVGILMGSLSGFLGGKVDLVVMKLVDFLMAFPYLVWVTLLMLVTGAGLVPMILALTLTGWLTMARIVRGQILTLKHEDYVVAAEAMGASAARVILKHMIPNTMGVIIVNLTFAIPAAIFSEAFLSFIGIGMRAPMTSWGLLVSMGMKQLYSYPLRLLIPCACISLTMLSLQIVGDGLRDALDPKLRR